MIRRPPRSTRMTHSFPTRRSSDLLLIHLGDGRARGQRNCRCAEEEIFHQSFPLLYAMRGIERPEAGMSMSLVEKIGGRSEEHTSELQSLMRISYAVFCLKKKSKEHQQKYHRPNHHHRQEIKRKSQADSPYRTQVARHA